MTGWLDGLPAAACWTGADLERDPRWRFAWPPAVIGAFRDAVLRGGTPRGTDLETLPRDAISGGALATVAEAVARELDVGTGVALIGSPNALPGVSPLDPWELRLIALLLAWELGPLIERYGRLYDVIDRGGSHLTERIPISQTSAETSFHTDSSVVDCNPAIVGLLCVRAAETGGDSRVASAGTVCARLAATDPASVEHLEQPWIRDLVTPGGAPTRAALLANRIPVIARDAGGGLVFRYMRYWIERGHARAGIPLPPAALRAFDRLDGELTTPGIAHAFRLLSGDLLLINNRRIAHDRSAFVDHADPARRRWLVRFWVGGEPRAS